MRFMVILIAILGLAFLVQGREVAGFASLILAQIVEAKLAIVHAIQNQGRLE